MKKMEFAALVTNGKLPRQTGQNIARLIAQMDGEHILITVAEQKRQRSNPQNRYYWGVVVAMVRQMFIDYGTPVSAEQVHEYLKMNVGKMIDMLIDPKGNPAPFLRTTTKLSTQEFEDYMEKIRAWAAGFGLIIPLPNEDDGGEAYYGEF